MNPILNHKYSYKHDNYTEICIFDISGNSNQAGALIELFTNDKNEYYMFVDDFDNKVNKKGKYWKQLTKKQVISIIDAYDNENDNFINNIFNNMDCKTYKNISCETFCKKLSLSILNI